MARSLKDYVIIALKGVAMGAADTVPGVSGGTIAFISGIYEELITSIGKVNFSLIKTWRTRGFSAMWKQFNGNFIAALLLGILFSVLTVMRLTSYLLDNYPILIWSFFFGLVLASIWFVGKQIDRWNFGAMTALVLGAAVAYWITTISAMGGENTWWFLVIAGALAICAMILPGISGAFILVLLGTYQEITDAVTDFNFKKIALVAVGAIVGLLSFSKLLKWLFAKFKNITLAVLTGFIAGSLNKIWPWKKILQSKVVHDKTIVLNEKTVWPSHFDGDPKVLYAVILLVVGFALIVILESLANNPTPDASNLNEKYMEKQKQVSKEILNVCNNGVDVMEKNYKPISEKGRVEAIIFNSLTTLNNVKSNYEDDYELISDSFFKLLAEKLRAVSNSLNNDELTDFVNSRYRYFNEELNKLYSGTPIPGGIFNVFYEQPLTNQPEMSTNLMEILPFFKALTEMMNYNSNNSKEI